GRPTGLVGPQVGTLFGEVVLDDRAVVGVELAISLRALREGDAQHSGELQQARVVELLLDSQRSDVVLVEVGVTQARDAHALLTSDATELFELHLTSSPWVEPPE